MAATPALAQRVTVDYAHDFDFETIQSFQYKDRLVLNTSHYGDGGYGAGYYGWGGTMGGSSTQVSTYTDGTLIVDGYEAKEKKVVWRGTGTVTMKAKPEKRVRQIEKILNKIGKRWDRILRNQGK